MVIRLVVLCAGIASYTFSSQTALADPATAFVVKVLVGKGLDKVLDKVWDKVTGKPNLTLLDQRLRELESSSMPRSEIKDQLRYLRESISEKVTREEFQKMAERTSNEILSIDRRLDDLEKRVERLEVENIDLKNGTKNASSATYFTKRGDEFAAAKQIERAIANYTLAIELDAANEEAYRGWCKLYQSLKAWGVVAEACTEAIAKLPSSAHLWFHRARACARGESIEAKLSHLRLRPFDDFRPFLSDEGLEFALDCEILLIDHPGDAEILTYRGISYLYYAHTAKPTWKLRSGTAEEVNRFTDEQFATRQKYRAEAKEYFETALKTNKNLYLAHCGRGLATLWLDPTPAGRQAAIDDFTAAIKLAPDNADAYALRGSCRGGEPEGIADLGKAIQLNPADPYFLFERANQLRMVNDNAKAIEDYLRLIEIAPEFRDAHSALSSIYYNMGEENKSRFHQERLEEIGELTK